MAHTSRRAEAEETELVAPKEFFSNNFPYIEAFCLQCQKLIAKIDSAVYHIKKQSRKKILDSSYDPLVITSNTLQSIMFPFKYQGVLGLQKED